MDLTIDRNIWLRGEEQSQSFLLRTLDDRQCCVGIYLEACGVPRHSLADRASAESINSQLPTEAQWLTENVDDTLALYTINDRDPIYIDSGYGAAEVRDLADADEIEVSEDDRERLISELFARN